MTEICDSMDPVTLKKVDLGFAFYDLVTFHRYYWFSCKVKTFTLSHTHENQGVDNIIEQRLQSPYKKRKLILYKKLFLSSDTPWCLISSK